MDSFKQDKNFMQLAERFMAEDAHLKEDDGMKMVMKMSKALDSFESFRADIKKIVEEKYPKKQKDFVKHFSGVDKEMAKLAEKI